MGSKYLHIAFTTKKPKTGAGARTNPPDGGFRKGKPAPDGDKDSSRKSARRPRRKATSHDGTQLPEEFMKTFDELCSALKGSITLPERFDGLGPLSQKALRHLLSKSKQDIVFIPPRLKDFPPEVLEAFVGVLATATAVAMLGRDMPSESTENIIMFSNAALAVVCGLKMEDIPSFAEEISS